jgi:hypothetical protein
MALALARAPPPTLIYYYYWLLLASLSLAPPTPPICSTNSPSLHSSRYSLVFWIT